MNGMLQHPDVYRDAAERRQQEAHQWARANSLGHLSRWAREQYADHPVRSRTLTITAPIGVGLALLAVIL